MRCRSVVMSSLALCLAISSLALAQSTARKAHFGVLGGVAFSKPGGPDATNIDGSHTGLAVGGFVTVQVTHGFAIEPEALYVQKGAKIKDTGGSGKVKVPYFEIPVLAKLRIPPRGGSIVSPHAYVGPALGFKAGCHASFTIGTTSISDSCDAATIDVKIKSTDLSLVFGGGVDIGRALLDVRYDLGLSKIDDNTSNNNVKNRTLYFLAGWTFRAAH